MVELRHGHKWVVVEWGEKMCDRNGQRSQYLIRRLLQGLLTLFAITVIVFLLASAYPGGIMSAYEENPDATAADYARLRAKYGLDDPLPVRYFKWLGNVRTRRLGYFVCLQTAGDRRRSVSACPTRCC